MLYVYGVEPPDADTLAVPETWQRLCVAVTELMTNGVAAGHWAFALSRQARTGRRTKNTRHTASCKELPIFMGNDCRFSGYDFRLQTISLGKKRC